MFHKKKNKLIQMVTIIFLLSVMNLFIISCAQENAKKETVPNLDAPIVFKWRFCHLGLRTGGFQYWSDLEPHITKEDLLNPEKSPVIKRRIEQLKEWGYNAMVCSITNKPMAEFLKENGFAVFIQRKWNEYEGTTSYHQLRTDISRRSRKLCPYNEDVRAYWKERIAKDYEILPELDGYCPMRGTECYGENGAPWMCDCEECQKRTPRERTRDAIFLIAGLLAEHGGTLIWETTQDDPEGMRYEGNYFKDLTGEIPENAFIMIKPFYWDFHPRWPRHPLFFTTSRDDRGHSPYMTYFQEPGEYRGVHRFPWCMVDEWSDVFRDMANMGQQGLLAGNSVYTLEYWEHPLNMVNMYAMNRFMRDPYADPKAIKLAWAKEQFGEESASTVVKVVDNVTEAARGMYEFDALWTGNHSQFPTLEYLDSHLCGPYRQNKRIDGLMGMEFPLDMYKPEKADEFRNNPQTRMLFSRYPINAQLKSEAMAQKDNAVILMKQSLELWKGLAGKFDEKMYTFVLKSLEGNLNDTIVFRHMMDIYFDWKLGVLTEEKIDAALEACHGLKGIIVPEPLSENPPGVGIVKPASLKTFAEKLRRELRDPWIENHWKKNPLGASVVDPLVDQKTGKKWK